MFSTHRGPAENGTPAHQLLDAIPDAVFFTDTNRRIRRINPGFSRLFGYSFDAVQGQSAQLLYARESDFIRQGELRYGPNPTGNYDNYRLQYLRRDGSRFTGETTGSPVSDAAGNPSGFVVIVRDVTAEQRDTERIRHLNAVLRALREINQLVVRETDPEIIIARACESLVRNRGYFNAWIALGNPETAWTQTAEAGLGGQFETLARDLRAGNPPRCVRLAMEKQSAAPVFDPETDCPDCPLSEHYGGGSGLVSPLSSQGQVFGVMAVSLPRELVEDPEEISLFQEMAGDLGFALRVRREAAALRREEERRRLYERIVSTVDAPMAFIDRDLVYRAVNDEYQRRFACPRGEIVGRTVREILGAEAYESGVGDRLTRCLNGEEQHFEIRYDFPGEGQRTMAMGYFPHRDRQGKIAGVISIGNDVTELKRTVEALDRSRRELAALNRIARVFLTVDEEALFPELMTVIRETLDSEFAYVGYIDEAGNLACPSMTREVWDQCRMPEKTILFPKSCWGGLWGKSLLEARTAAQNGGLSPPEGHIPIDSALAVPVSDHDGLVGQFVIANKPGGYSREDARLLETIAAQTGPVLAARLREERHRRERERLEKQVRQSQKMEAMGALAGGIAHDFNNILGVVLGFSELAMEELDDPAALEQDLEEVIAAGNRARELVRQILSFSRGAERERRPMKLAPLLKEVVNMLRRSFPSTISVHLDVETPCEGILADPTQMHQVIMNLCTNAFHAMREQAASPAASRECRLDLALRPVTLSDREADAYVNLAPGDYAELTIADTGHGMGPETLERIFEPYFTTKDAEEGTGLGLAIVHSIIRSSDGAVRVESAPDRGTQFTILLPVFHPPQDARNDPAPISMPTGGEERVILVDDDPAVLRVTARGLTDFGYRVQTFPDGAQALAAVAADPDAVDIVVTDLTMPRMTGTELLSRLLEIRPGLPVLLCTGFSDLLTESEAIRLGARGMSLKPMVGRALARKIRKTLDGAPASA
jgi:PAS domain S-box-containing protein